ncbi:putative bifunctional diguanylate cyclase/phosphodiesterase [Rhizobium helianthi]|uniref:Bifunctional diguanylate cyclase/phosphodiesterase n=1 Tax=Rhizobium helianthi TaxID=1132695 RepID=A0ABW4M932_9HYPH
MHQASTDAQGRRSRASLLDHYYLGRNYDDAFTRSFCKLISSLAKVPIAYVSLISDDQQIIRACSGAEIGEISRQDSICNLAIEQKTPLIILDAALDERVRNLPIVATAPHIRFYAGVPLTTPDGHVLGALCFADTSPRKSWSAAKTDHMVRAGRLLMEHYEARREGFPATTAASFINATELSMISVDRSGTVQFVNESLLRLLGYAREEIIGQNVSVIVPQRFRASHDHSFDRLSTSQGPLLNGKTVEVFARHRNGTEIPIEITLTAWTDANGLGVGAIINDISERRARDARLLRLANQDPVTGFNTRHHWEELLEQHIATHRSGTVILAELDGLRETGDRLGQDVFDTLLQSIAVRLPRVLSKDCLIARFTEEQIGILVPSAQTVADAQTLSEAVLSELALPFDLGTMRLKIRPMIGYARRGEAADAREWLANADFALMHAKRGGGKTAVTYEGPLAQAALRNRVARDELLEALNKKQFVLHYQPQVMLETGELSGIEALIRWEHPERGLILPGAFLPALEQSALSLDVGAWVMQEATRQLGEWIGKGLPPIKMGMNLFPSQIRGSDLPREISDLASRHGIDPKWLELEITETATLEDEDRAFELISELRELGIGIAFDDFGTGYASLGSLQRYPITTLKIDRGFVRDLMSRQRDAAITRALIMLSHDLGLKTIAEGVESLDQQIALRLMGCDYGQGFLYGRALPASDIETMLAARMPRRRNSSKA